VQVRLIVKEALKMLRSSLPATIQIEQDLQSESVIYADPTQIHQIVMNLCTNAYHAMREEGGVLRIQLADVTRKHLRSKDNQQQTAKYLKMTVSDTGHGIPADIIDRIFEP
jgi:signal transduction histidine kinase